MAFLCVDKDGTESIHELTPKRGFNTWLPFLIGDDEYSEMGDVIELPKGSIEKLIGINLTWEDEPVELK